MSLEWCDLSNFVKLCATLLSFTMLVSNCLTQWRYSRSFKRKTSKNICKKSVRGSYEVDKDFVISLWKVGKKMARSSKEHSK